MTDVRQERQALVVTGPPTAGGQQAASLPEATLLTMNERGRVTAYSGKVEYGQSIRTGLAMEVADELDVPLSTVEVVLGDTGLVPFDRGTTGSASTATVGRQLRRAAATARKALVELAGQRWGMAAGDLTAQEGAVLVRADAGRRATYADLLAGQQLALRVADDVAVKEADEFAVMGQPTRRIDAVARVTGQAKYSQDIVVPGMVYGKVLRPPSYGAQLRQLDASRAEHLPGFVALVREGDFVGIVTEREEQAEYALQAVRARWEEGQDQPSDWDMPVALKEHVLDTAVLREDGSLERGFAEADRVFEEVYYVPYVANATMEPMAAVAQWEGDPSAGSRPGESPSETGQARLTVWCGSRRPFGIRSELAQAFGMSEDRVHVITPETGGAFGGAREGVAHDAARLAKAVGRPVRVAYTRAEDFSWATVRPAALIEIRSGVKADGTIVAWDYRAWHAGENAFRARRGSDTPYATPNVRIQVANAESPLRAGSYRSLGGAVNHFAREVHIDEIATALEMDPVELRLRNLTHPRFRRVLTEAAARFGWDAARGPSSGVGVAIGLDVGTYAAECVQLAVRGREVQVARVVVAFDCGLVVNPDGVRNQVEGAIVMGLGTALWEGLEFAGGRILNPTFSRYRVPRITDAPEVEVVLVGDATTPSTGAGEPGIVPIAPAIANAVFSATGKRVRELPIGARLG